MSRQARLERALRLSQQVLGIHRDVMSSLPFSISEIAPEYTGLLEELAAALIDLEGPVTTPASTVPIPTDPAEWLSWMEGPDRTASDLHRGWYGWRGRWEDWLPAIGRLSPKTMDRIRDSRP